MKLIFRNKIVKNIYDCWDYCIQHRSVAPDSLSYPFLKKLWGNWKISLMFLNQSKYV